MISNYFKIAFRNLKKNKVYSFINIGGLATGMAVAMLIGLWVWDEVSYNQSHENYQHIGQVYRNFTEPLEQHTVSTQWLPQPMAKVLNEKYKHLFKHVVLLRPSIDFAVQVGENSLTKKGQFIENGVIDMFSLKMQKGSAASLDDQQAIIISESTAKALFGDKDPINQSIKLDNKIDAKITGVYEDIAQNSIFGNIEFFGNYENMRENNPSIQSNQDNWSHTSHWIYVQTADNVTIEQASAAINDLYLKDAPSDFAEGAKKYKTNVWLYPMKDWYLYSEFKDGKVAGGRITFVWLFGVVGIFVLLLACINFINLSTARSEKRAKEVGIRKAIGSLRIQLINQFLSESFVVVFIAFVVCLLIVLVSLSTFNQLADKSISIPFTNIYFWFASITFLILTSLLSGLYPAFYLSSFQPVKVLKGTLRLGKFASLPRKTLVVIQFTTSVVLIIGTVIVYQQIQYAQNRPIGYNNKGLVRIPMRDSHFANNKLAMKDELIASGVAKGIAFSSSPVTEIWDNWGGFTWKGKNPESESSFTVTWVSEDFGKAVEWKLKQGRDFSKEFGTDSSAVIINESAAKYLRLKNPVGEFIRQEGSNESRQIIGIVNDVVAASPYEPVSTGFYWLDKNLDNASQMQIKINPDLPVSTALAKIEAIQKKYIPSAPFNYRFVDEEFANKFKAEQRISKLASLFAILAIFISCLGLFGLASFVAEQRTKEIGIRKVLGATVLNLWQMLSKDFVVLVIISSLIAAPIAYYFMDNWLQKYNYHTQISGWVFILAAVGALAITLLTVSYQAIKAALVNPVKSLKSE